MIFSVFPQAQNCVRFSQVFNVDNDPQTLIRQQAPNSELSGSRTNPSMGLTWAIASPLGAINGSGSNGVPISSYLLQYL